MPKKTYKYKPVLTKNQVDKMKKASNVLLVCGLLFLFLAFAPVIYDEVWYQYKQLRGQEFVVGAEGEGRIVGDSPFGKLLAAENRVVIQPVNKDFALIIEKIGVNVPIVIDVPVTDQDAYLEALHHGVAHASSSYYPSEEPGNVYLFAHASIDFWRLGRYATVFNLLRKLDLGDRVHVFYNNQQFIYEVVNKEVIQGFNVYPLTRPVIEPTLTLQTCDPPGTTLNRLVVTSKLVEVIDL